jgi:alpha-galactosidase
MAKIVLIGAGSHSFARYLISDVLSYPELRSCTIMLMDISKEPLDLITAYASKLVEQYGFDTKIESTTNRREALEGADYVVVTIQVGGRRQAARDITEKYGIEDGSNGVFNGLKQIPVILDICHDMEELCPDAWLLEYSNPVPTICWAVNDYTNIKNVGLCHSVQATSYELARYIGVPYKNIKVPEGAYFPHFGHIPQEEFREISYWVAGINHMAWFLEFKWQEKDAYPLLREKFKDPAVYSGLDAHWDGPDVVRAEIFKAFGYFNTEASSIVAHMIPYFFKNNRPELFERFKLVTPKTRDNDIKKLDKTRREQDKIFRDQLNGDIKFPIIRSTEYCATIIHSIETGIPSRINGNVKNNGLISNLSDGCCVEVPCLVDKKGISPCYVGNLPPQLAALNQANINSQELAVRGTVEKDRTKIFQAILLHPYVGAMLTIDEIRQMVGELFQIEKGNIDDFEKAG